MPPYAPEGANVSEPTKILRNLSREMDSFGNTRNADVDELNSRDASCKSDLTRAIDRIHTANELDYTKVHENMKTVIGKLEDTTTRVCRMRDMIIRELQTVGGNHRKFNDRPGTHEGKFLEQEDAIYGSGPKPSLES